MLDYLSIDFALTVIGQHRFVRLRLGLACALGSLAAAEGAVHRKCSWFDNVGIGHDVDARGTSALECTSERWSDPASLIDELAMGAQSLCGALVVNDPQLGSNRVAGTPRKYLAVLRHTPLHVVIDHYRHREVVPYRGIELREVEPDRAVADHAHNLPLRMGDLWPPGRMVNRYRDIRDSRGSGNCRADAL